MTEQLVRPLSDGSFWTINLNITKPSDISDCPPEGFLNIDLVIKQTYRVVESQTIAIPNSQEFTVPTKHFPGTMNRAEYYSALHQWLRHIPLNLPLDRDVVNDFTDHIIDRVFARVNLHDKLALRVAVDLHLVSVVYEALPIEFEMEMEEDVEEDEQGLPGYWVHVLTDFFSVVAAEEHLKFGDCSICLDGLFSVNREEEEEEEEEERNKYLFGSPCGHFFHDKCMMEWLRRSDSCPLCRFRFLSRH